MVNFDHPQLCPTCQGYKTMPYAWSSTNQPRLCSCPKPTSLAWECTRCGKINAPWKGSCDCAPSPLSNIPTSAVQPFNTGPIPFDHYFGREDEV
jgi:hypothetical protein